MLASRPRRRRLEHPLRRPKPCPGLDGLRNLSTWRSREGRAPGPGGPTGFDSQRWVEKLGEQMSGCSRWALAPECEQSRGSRAIATAAARGAQSASAEWGGAGEKPSRRVGACSVSGCPAPGLGEGRAGRSSLFLPRLGRGSALGTGLGSTGRLGASGLSSPNPAIAASLARPPGGAVPARCRQKPAPSLSPDLAISRIIEKESTSAFGPESQECSRRASKAGASGPEARASVSSP